jgi:protein TonB
MGRAIPLMPPPVLNEPFAVFLERPHHDVEARRSATVGVSLVLHATLVFAALVVPLLLDSNLPAPNEAIRAFFVAPPEVAPPPPPPPPPAAASSLRTAKPVTQPAALEPARFVAPIEMPSELPKEEGLELGVEGGVAGGVEGGVPGGVVGGVVGGLPDMPPPPAAKVVRIGGQIVAPKLMRSVQPVYPEIAKLSRVQGLVILEALVGTNGAVKTVKVLRGNPLLEEAAMEAVRQWRYQPLLLNGEPTEFILSVTVMFTLVSSQAP